MERFSLSCARRLCFISGDNYSEIIRWPALPTQSLDITCHVLPIRRLSEDFPRAIDESTMCIVITLEPVHKPCGGVTEISVDAVHTRRLGGLTAWLAGYIVVVRTNERSLSA